MGEYDPLDLEGQESAAADQKTAAEQEALGEIGDVVWLMKNKRGRRIIWRLLVKAGVFRLSFSGEAVQLTAFNEGQRNIGLQLMALINVHCGDDYALMLQERKANG